MNKVGAPSALLVLAFLFACTTTVEVKKAPPLICERNVILSKGFPLEETATFSEEDNEVIAAIQCKNLSGEHKVRWDWYDPNGKLFLSTGNYPFYASSESKRYPAEGKYIKEATALQRLSIPDVKKAPNYIGNWRVDLYLDKDLIASKNFKMGVGLEIDIAALPKIAQKPSPENWGLVVGLENYSRLPTVPYAQKDALLVKEYFRRVFGVPEEQIIFLPSPREQANKSILEGYLKSYLPKNVGKTTNLYVYFAGHGFPDVKKQETYLMLYEGDTRFIEQTGYNLKSFYEDLNNLDIKRAYVFLDTCFSGIAARTERTPLAQGARAVLIHAPIDLHSDKVISLTASTGGQISSPYSEREHGLFTYFLLSGLKGAADTNEDGWITVKELYSYVKDNVTRVSRRKGIEQTPLVVPSFGTLKGIEDLKISRVPR